MPMAKDIRTKETRDDWCTPHDLILKLGPFDLDPCGFPEDPLPGIAKTLGTGGLDEDWGKAMVFMNPPYGDETKLWLKKFAEHGRGIALVFARVETKYWFKYVWKQQCFVFFPKGRIKFNRPAGFFGDPNKDGAKAPSALIGFGKEAYLKILKSNIPGALVNSHMVTYR